MFTTILTSAITSLVVCLLIDLYKLSRLEKMEREMETMLGYKKAIKMTIKE